MSKKEPMSKKKPGSIVGVSRRRFLQLGGAGLGALSLGGLSLPGCRDAGEDDRYFYIAVLADTHIIDDFYTGPEGSPEDTESIFHSRERLESARAVINGLSPRIEKVFIAGDVVHNYPSQDYDFYFQNDTRWDVCKRLLDGFEMDVHPGLGNHDYDIGAIPRQFTHDLFQAKMGIEPYYAVEHKGWSFVHVSNFLGATMDPQSSEYSTTLGSLGVTQLDWLEGELQRGRPTMIFLHYPLPMIVQAEVPERGLRELLRQYQETIRLVVAGHLHVWWDYEDSFGPPSMLAASTRYDPNAFLVIELDRKAGSLRILNWDRLEWYSHFAAPYAG